MQYVYRSEQVSNPSKACEEHRQKSFLFYVNDKGPYFVGQPLASDPPETVMRRNLTTEPLVTMTTRL